MFPPRRVRPVPYLCSGINPVITLKRDVLGYVRISEPGHICLHCSCQSVSSFNGEMKSPTRDWALCVSPTPADWSNCVVGGGPWWFTLGSMRGEWGPRGGCVGKIALVHTSGSLWVGIGWWSHSGWEGAACWVFLAAAKSRIKELCKCSNL